MLRYNPSRYRVFDNSDTTIGQLLEKEFTKYFPNLFVYYHAKHGNYVVAEWIKKWSSFVEIYVIGPFLGLFDYQDKEVLAAKMLLNRQSGDFLEKLSDEEYESNKKLIEVEESRRDRKRFRNSSKVQILVPSKKLIV